MKHCHTELLRPLASAEEKDKFRSAVASNKHFWADFNNLNGWSPS